MCSGQTNALPNTHTVIYATLEVQSSSVRFSQSTRLASTSASATPSSTFVTSTRPTSTSAPSTPSFMSSASSSVASPPTSTQTAVRQTQTPSPVSETNLTKSQIVGITVAAIGGGALMLGIIIIIACVKRRQARRNRDSDELPFQIDPTKYPQSIKSRKSTRRLPAFGPGGTSNGLAQKVAPPVPPRLDTMSPNMFSRSSIQPDQVIGLAISPESRVQTRSESKLLPPKPVLKLQMPPKAAGAFFSKSAPKPMTFERSSTATQFEEDYQSTGWKPQVPTLKGAGLTYPKPAQKPSLSRESTATQFEDVEDNIRKSQIANARGVSYIQPKLKSSDAPRGSTTTQFEEDDAINSRMNKTRKSTATQFEEDEEATSASSRPKYNWSRRSAVEEDVDTAIDMWEKFSPINTSGPPAVYFKAADVQRAQISNASSRGSNSQAKPVPIGRGIGSFSQPRRPNEYPPRAKPDNLGLDAFPRPPTSTLPPSLQIPIPAGASRPVTATSSVYTTRTSSLQGSPTRRSNPPMGSLPQIPQAYKQVGPYDGPRTGNSSSSFDTDNSRLSPGGPRTAELSPVVESPASGKSPVSYPKIPKPGRLSEEVIRTVPPPPQPNFNVSSEKPWRAAELAAQRERQLRRSSSLTGPPQGIEINIPQRAPRIITNYTPQSPNWDTYTPSPLSPSGPSFSSSNLPFARQNQPQIPLPAKQQQQQYAKQFQPSLGLSQKPGYATIPSPNSSNRPPRSSPGPAPVPEMSIPRPSSGLSHISEASMDTPSLPSRTSTASKSSQASSLLARRRGPERVPITLSDSPDAKKKWRVLKGSDVHAAKSPQWRPMLGQSNGMLSPLSAHFEGRQTQYAGRKEFERMEPAELPGTPGWVPRLTPTRKGEDLYLRVG